MQLRLEELTVEAFAPFGRLVQRPTQAPDASGDDWQWWAETVVLPSDGRPHGIGYFCRQPGERSFDWAERHLLSAELVVAAEGDLAIYVAPPDAEKSPRTLALDRFRVFRLEQGQGALIGAGVWHGAPLAIDRPVTVVVALAQGTGATDTTVIRFPQTPVRVEW